MKNPLLKVTYLLIILFTTACTKENNEETLEPDILSGTWIVVKTAGGALPINTPGAPVSLYLGEGRDSSIFIEFRNNHEYYFSFPDLETETGEYEIISDTLVYFSPLPSKFLNFCFGNINQHFVTDTALLNQFPSYDHNFSLDTLVFKLPENSEMEIYTYRMYEALVEIMPDNTEDTVAYFSQSVNFFIKLRDN